MRGVPANKVSHEPSGIGQSFEWSWYHRSCKHRSTEAQLLSHYLSSVPKNTLVSTLLHGSVPRKTYNSLDKSLCWTFYLLFKSWANGTELNFYSSGVVKKCFWLDLAKSRGNDAFNSVANFGFLCPRDPTHVHLLSRSCSENNLVIDWMWDLCFILFQSILSLPVLVGRCYDTFQVFL